MPGLTASELVRKFDTSQLTTIFELATLALEESGCTSTIRDELDLSDSECDQLYLALLETLGDSKMENV